LGHLRSSPSGNHTPGDPYFLALEGDTGSISQKVSAETRFVSDF